MKVGDLVKHKQRGHAGLVVRIEYAEGGHDPLFYIKWIKSGPGVCWREEIEVINEGR